mmetsp:Transcript_21147/g.53308  ORF Transcript_21147/g.53308 Transcript_21147/m.53308 type:complete len:292 (-) Transcript_21147:668-1543(-)
MPQRLLHAHRQLLTSQRPVLRRVQHDRALRFHHGEPVLVQNVRRGDLKPQVVLGVVPHQPEVRLLDAVPVQGALEHREQRVLKHRVPDLVEGLQRLRVREFSGRDHDEISVRVHHLALVQPQLAEKQLETLLRVGIHTLQQSRIVQVGRGGGKPGIHVLDATGDRLVVCEKVRELQEHLHDGHRQVREPAGVVKDDLHAFLHVLSRQIERLFKRLHLLEERNVVLFLFLELVVPVYSPLRILHLDVVVDNAWPLVVLLRGRGARAASDLVVGRAPVGSCVHTFRSRSPASV